MDKASKVKYIYSEDYNPLYVNGAYGGSNPNGEIVIHFYHERLPVPKKSTLTISESSHIEEFESDGYGIVRFVQNGIIMNVTTAKMIHDWLGAHILKMEEMIDDGNPDHPG